MSTFWKENDGSVAKLYFQGIRVKAKNEEMMEDCTNGSKEDCSLFGMGAKRHYIPVY